jgi:hypothetical protein
MGKHQKPAIKLVVLGPHNYNTYWKFDSSVFNTTKDFKNMFSDVLLAVGVLNGFLTNSTSMPVRV